MSPPELHERVMGAVLLVNETYRTHSIIAARKLHCSDWYSYVSREGKHLDPSSFTGDPEKSALLLETVERVLNSLPSQEQRQALTLRFGIDDGTTHPIHMVAQSVFPLGLQIPYRNRKVVSIMRSGLSALKQHPRGDYLLAFYGNKTAQQIRAELEALPSLDQLRATAP